MHSLLMCLLLVGWSAAPAAAADPLAEARRLYNQGEYDTAARYAREAARVPATAESARLVLGRILLERFRRSADPVDLTEARDALVTADAAALDPRERTELAIGLGEALFFEDRFGSASESFERALQRSEALGASAHEGVLDWWATSLDRLALSRPREGREPIYLRIIGRMEKELAAEPSSAPAAYWLAAALRGAGNVERAWHAAMAGWVLARLGRDYGAALRADLERLVEQAIIPERAAQLNPKDPRQTAVTMRAEWDAFKDTWSR